MTSFQILKGDSSRIDMDVTPFEDGAMYLTLDDGSLYVDAIVNGVNTRIKTNKTYTDAEISKISTLISDLTTLHEQEITGIEDRVSTVEDKLKTATAVKLTTWTAADIN